MAVSQQKLVFSDNKLDSLEKTDHEKEYSHAFRQLYYYLYKQPC
jgi:hypothetical protein